jgi:dihydrofolate reductase
MVKMIWAMDESCLIGSNNKMPWHIKEDLIYYKEKTKDSAVLMGYNTYLSLLGYYKGKDFPYKKTFVLSNSSIDDNRISVVNNLNEFLTNLDFDLFVVGGKACYEQCMPYADELYVSYVLGKHEGDTYMEPVDENLFELISSKTGESGKVRYTIYKRK